jgi:hypothetical protein
MLRNSVKVYFRRERLRLLPHSPNQWAPRAQSQAILVLGLANEAYGVPTIVGFQALPVYHQRIEIGKDEASPGRDAILVAAPASSDRGHTGIIL